MKTLLGIVNRAPKPAPWSEGDNIPWNDPDFSERMLVEHLSQEHDLASRKSETIDLNITVDQALQFIVSCGVVVPPNQIAADVDERDRIITAEGAHSPLGPVYADHDE